jgi:hypothetical protein
VPVADRLGLQLATSQPVLVEELLEGASNQQRRPVECSRFFMGIHDRGQTIDRKLSISTATSGYAVRWKY